MTVQDKIDRAALLMDRIVEKDLDGQAELFSDDIVYEYVSEGPLEGGKAALLEQSRQMFGDLKKLDFLIDHWGVNGNIVFSERSEYMVYPQFEGVIPTISVFELNESGQICAWREYYDQKTMKMGPPDEERPKYTVKKVTLGNGIEKIELLMKCICEKDYDGQGKLVSDDIRNTDYPYGMTEGKDAFINKSRKTFENMIHIEINILNYANAVDGNTVLTEMEAHLESSSEKIHVRFTSSFDFDDAGKICAWRSYFDTNSMNIA